MVAGIEVSIVHQGQSQAAGGPEGAERPGPPQPAGQGAVEVQDESPPHVPFHPFGEDPYQEPAPLVRSHRTVRHPVSLPETTLIVPLHDRDELEVMGPEFISEEPVDLQRMIGVLPVDRAEDVEFHLVFLEQASSFQDPVESSLAPFILAVKIVKLPGAVHAEADEEAVIMEKTTPFGVQKDAVGL